MQPHIGWKGLRLLFVDTIIQMPNNCVQLQHVRYVGDAASWGCDGWLLWVHGRFGLMAYIFTFYVFWRSKLPKCVSTVIHFL